jgi:hypothetical protein
MWSILQAESSEEVTRLMGIWYAGVKNDPELADLPGFDACMRAEDWKGARGIVERMLGRNHPRHRKTLDVLFAAVQNRRLMEANERRSAMDLIARVRPVAP